MTDILTKARAWFEDVTEADFNLIGWMGLTKEKVIEMYLKEHPKEDENAKDC